MEVIKIKDTDYDQRTMEMNPVSLKTKEAKEDDRFLTQRFSSQELPILKGLSKDSKFKIVHKEKNLYEIDGILSIIVDKYNVSDEDGMKNLISMLQKKKSKIQGIVIQDFGGTFKVDYLKRIELTLRELKKLITLVIYNTNLNREHIQILRNIIWWRKDTLKQIYLTKNSMDSIDFTDLFVSSDFNFTDLKNLSTLDVKVQPGINKLTQNQFKQFTNLITQKSTELSSSKKSSRENLYISLDDTSLNNRHRKLLRKNSDQSFIQLKNSIIQRTFFSLNLGGCFSDKNEGGLRYFGEYLIGENFDDIIKLSFRNTTLKTPENWIPICSFLKRTKTILDIDLSSCHLNDNIVSNLFSSVFSIKSIDISNNHNIQQAGWKKIFESLICHKDSVTDTIRMDNCSLENKEVKVITNVFKSFYQKIKNSRYKCPLQKFYFNYNSKVETKGFKRLFKRIFEMASQSLKILELRGCDLDEDSLLNFQNALKKSYKKGEIFISFITSLQGALEELVLRNNPKLGKATSLISSVLTILFQKSNFKKIDLSNCCLDDEGLAKILQAIPAQNLTEIVLKNNPGIGKKSYDLIAREMIFNENSKMLKVDISGNKIKKENFSDFIKLGKEFIKAGKKNSVLKKFILNYSTQLNDDVFKELVQLFLFNGDSIQLEKLSLKNTLTTKKVEHICSQLKELERNKKDLSLQQICFDKNALPEAMDMVRILEAFLIKSQACPKLEILSFAYCNIWNDHAMVLFEQLEKKKWNKTSPLKKLCLKGNVTLTSDGWIFLSYILFQSGIMVNLESLDISYCQLDETSISSICLSFVQEDGSLPLNYTPPPLSELTMNNNPKLDFFDWQNIIQSLIFSKSSKIKTVNAQNCNLDSKVMEKFLEEIKKSKKEQEKHGIIEGTNKQQLANLNISQNDQIDDNTWKRFISVYILDKSSDSAFEKEQQNQLEFEKTDAVQVKKKFDSLQEMYSDKIKQSNATGSLPLFQITHLDLKGTSTLDGTQWKDLFSLLIVNERSQITFLGLSQTYLEHASWENIFELIQKYTSHEKHAERILKIKTIEFNDNQYLTPNQWQQCFEKFFFNKKLLSLTTLELSNCKLNHTILDYLNELYSKDKEVSKTGVNNVKEELSKELEVLKVNKNPQIKSLNFLSTFSKIRVIDCDSSEIAQAPNLKSLEEIVVKITTKDHDKCSIIQSYCERFPNLTAFSLRNSSDSQILPIFDITKSTCSQLIKFSAHNQIIESEYLFQSILFAIQVGTKLKKIDLYGATIKPNPIILKEIEDKLKALIEIKIDEKKEKQEMENKSQKMEKSKKKIIQKHEIIDEEKIKKEKINEEKKKIIEEQEKIMLKKWEPLMPNQNPDNSKENEKLELILLNLSSTTSTQLTEEARDSVATVFILRYVAQHCTSLQELYISNCFMSEITFQSFCLLYSKNTSLSIKKLDVSNNQQLKTKSWEAFFQYVLFQEKSQFEYLNISKNLFEQEDFQNIAKYSQRLLYYSKFYVKILSMKDIPKNISTSVWVNTFFSGFIEGRNHNVETIYLNDSLNLEAQNGVSKFLEIYAKDRYCKIKAVYGYDEITQIFKDKNSSYFKSLNIPSVLKTHSQFEVIEMWKQSLVSSAITTIEHDNTLNEEFVSGIPRMRLNIFHDFFDLLNLKIADSKRLHERKIQTGENVTDKLCFDYESLKYISKFFSREESANSSSNNLFTIILNDAFLNYFKQHRYEAQIYFIPHRNLSGIDTQQMYDLYFKFKDTNIDRIVIDYDLRQVDLDPNLSERRLINFIRMCPPKSLELTNVSVNALKAIYSIVSSNSNFRYANVNFSSESFINNGIAFSLREQLYMGKKRKNFFLRAINYLVYCFLNLFCVEAEIYKFNEKIPQLNENLKSQRRYFNLMIFLTIIYYAICIFIPYFLTKHFGVYVKTKDGVAWASHYVYAGFAGVSFIVEIIIYSFAYRQIKDLLPTIINVENVDDDDRSYWSRFKRFLQKNNKILEWISYIVQLILSQIDRFDLYSDMCFIVICMKMEQYIIGFISLGVFANQLIINIFKLLIFIRSIFVQDNRRLLNTHEINSFCELSNLVEFEALNSILDTVSPYNISFIPNWYIFRKLIPSFAGQSISNRLMNSIQKFLFQDILQIVLQAAYVISQHQSTDLTVILSIVSTIISLIKAFYKFMSTRPTTISQLDFDYLSKEKKKYANEYHKEIVRYRDDMLKNLEKSHSNYKPNSVIDIQQEQQQQNNNKKSIKS